MASIPTEPKTADFSSLFQLPEDIPSSFQRMAPQLAGSLFNGEPSTFGSTPIASGPDSLNMEEIQVPIWVGDDPDDKAAYIFISLARGDKIIDGKLFRQGEDFAGGDVMINHEHPQAFRQWGEDSGLLDLEQFDAGNPSRTELNGGSIRLNSESLTDEHKVNILTGSFEDDVPVNIDGDVAGSFGFTDDTVENLHTIFPDGEIQDADWAPLAGAMSIEDVADGIHIDPELYTEGSAEDFPPDLLERISENLPNDLFGPRFDLPIDSLAGIRRPRVLMESLLANGEDTPPFISDDSEMAYKRLVQIKGSPFISEAQFVDWGGDSGLFNLDHFSAEDTQGSVLLNTESFIPRMKNHLLTNIVLGANAGRQVNRFTEIPVTLLERELDLDEGEIANLREMVGIPEDLPSDELFESSKLNTVQRYMDIDTHGVVSFDIEAFRADQMGTLPGPHDQGFQLLTNLNGGQFEDVADFIAFGEATGLFDVEKYQVEGEVELLPENFTQEINFGIMTNGLDLTGLDESSFPASLVGERLNLNIDEQRNLAEISGAEVVDGYYHFGLEGLETASHYMSVDADGIVMFDIEAFRESEAEDASTRNFGASGVDGDGEPEPEVDGDPEPEPEVDGDPEPEPDGGETVRGENATLPSGALAYAYSDGVGYTNYDADALFSSLLGTDVTAAQYNALAEDGYIDSNAWDISGLILVNPERFTNNDLKAIVQNNLLVDDNQGTDFVPDWALLGGTLGMPQPDIEMLTSHVTEKYDDPANHNWDMAFDDAFDANDGYILSIDDELNFGFQVPMTEVDVE